MDSQQRRSLADDPKFLEQLEDLDAGLLDDEESTEEENRAAPPEALAEVVEDFEALDAAEPVPPVPPAPAPRGIPPQVRAAAAARHAARQAPPARPPVGRPPAPIRPPIGQTIPEAIPLEAPPASAPAPGGRRPLLDLFPPAPVTAIPSTLPRSERLAPLEPLSQRPSRLPSSMTPAAALVPPTPVAYETFYGLTERPFALTSDPKFLYHSTSHERAVQTLAASLGRGAQMVVLTGDMGSGKTTVCRAVAARLDRRTLTAFAVDQFASAEDLLRTMLVEFGVVAREDVARGRLTKASRAELLGPLQTFLRSLAPLQASAVLFVDEAQNLPAGALDALRALSEPTAGRPPLQVVLSGQSHLLEVLTGAELGDVNAVVATRCRLEPLGADEVPGYIAHRLAVAGSNGRVEFDDRACERIYAASGGAPRLVNLLCDRALTLGYDAAASVITDKLVKHAAADLDLEPVTHATGATVGLLRAAALILCACLGAGVAAFVYHDRLALVMDRWVAAPSAPSAPHLGVPKPLEPKAVPPDAPRR